MQDIDFLKGFIENLFDGILIIDKNGIIIADNPAALALFGYEPNELFGRHIEDIMLLAERPEEQSHINRFLSGDTSAIIGKANEIQAVRKDASFFPARLVISEIRDTNKQFYAGVIHDLSVEKKLEEHLRHYTEELGLLVTEKTQALSNTVQALEQAKNEVTVSLDKEKETSRLKSQFVSTASHQFRTPLSSIQLSASLIEHYFDRLNKDKIFIHLKKIASAVKDMTAMLNDLLSLEKIESGKVSLEIKCFDINLLFGEILKDMEELVKPGQQLIYRHQGENATVFLDKNSLKHCITNLVSNALKYSLSDGVIELLTEVDKKNIRIEVKDNGIGIPGDEQCHLFESFFRAQNVKEIQGTGLGLNIVKRYMDLMNGKINYYSELAKGTIFNLVIPQGNHNLINGPYKVEKC
jgi:two-component system sensor kinase FixL